MHDDDPWRDGEEGWGRQGRILWPTLRYAALVLIVVGAVAGGLAYRGGPLGEVVVADAKSEPERARPKRARAAAPGGREIVVRPGAGGHFLLDAVVNGEEIRFIVDTGASKVALSPEDARRLGFEPEMLDFTERYQTANGVALGAPVVLRELRVGQLSLTDVRATVMSRPMPLSLLGMSFLRRLSGHEVRDGKLVLRW